jgi:hypothetical protein
MTAGASFAEYINQDVTAKISLFSSEVTLFASAQTEALVLSNIKTGVTVHTIPLVAEATYALSDGGIGGGFASNLESETSVTHETQSTSSITFSFSETTSDGIYYAGRLSTMFLTPSLTIVFSKSLRVMFNQDMCMATGSEVTTWSLDDGAGNFKVRSVVQFPELIFQSLAWKNIYDIENEVITTMKELIDEQKTLEKLENAKPKPNAKELSDIKVRIARLTEGLDGWQQQINRVDALYRDAGKNSSINIMPVKNLVSNQLLQKDGKDSVTWLNGSMAENANEIRDISAISFVGGGSSIQYTEESSSETSKSNGGSFSLLRSVSAIVAGDPVVTPVKVEFRSEISLGGRVVLSGQDTTLSSTTFSRAFTLSDPDEGDSFDVKVYRDPVYGSYFFVTAAGASRSDLVITSLSIHAGACGSPTRCAARKPILHLRLATV